MITDEIYTSHGEPHFVWPHRFDGGNSVRCGSCRYFAEDFKSKDARMRTGECQSKAFEADKLHFCRKVADIHDCGWWFPIGKQTGEQEELWREDPSK